ncbi:hypothetical protein [Nonomuraea fuscirosea]|uniref:hypothetical protein n=1 Tax=Nonomuraea fuscirosea TaxID=1291556 RepID=UPI0033DD812B
MITTDFAVATLLGAVLALSVVLGAVVALAVRARAPRTPAPAPARPAERTSGTGPDTGPDTGPVKAVQAPVKTGGQQAERAALQKSLQEARRQAETNRQWYAAAIEESGHLLQRLQAVADEQARGYAGVSVPALLHPGFKDSLLAKHHQSAIDLLGETIRATRDDIDRSARTGVRGMADEVQMYLARLQMKIDEAFQDFPTQTPFHQTLVDLDALTTWSLHAVQRLRVLTGSWPGMQRADCTLREIVEGARGRISAYNRVDHTYLPDVGEQYVEGRVVEPITIALTELLSNAATYSSDRVSVYVTAVPAGLRIVVEDAGYGMNAFQLAEAERRLSARADLDVAGLADERKLGFAVIGRLAHDYGFRVDVSAPSGSGGVKAVCLIPSSVINPAPAGQRPAAGERRGDETPTAPQPPALATAVPAPAPVMATTPQGLPKRERRQEPATPRPAVATQEALTDTRSPEEAAAGLETLRRAFTTGLTAEAADPEGNAQA